MGMKILYQFILSTIILFLCLQQQSNGQTTCTISSINCPPNDLVPACANTIVNGVPGSYVYWTPPSFTLSCLDGTNQGYTFYMSYDLPEARNECWVYSKVQRIGSGRLRLWQSTQTNSDPNPNFMTPAFSLPLTTTNGSILISDDFGKIFRCNIYLVYPDGTLSPLNSTFLVTSTNEYQFTITPPTAGVYRLYFQFTGNGDNRNYVDELKIGAPLDGISCTADIDYSIVTDGIPGSFFPVGATPVTYTAICNSCNPPISETCSFNVIVNGVTASATKTDATCALNNGTITITAASSNASPALQYNINNAGWVNFSSPVTITGLTQGIKTINVRDYFSNNSSYCEILSPISLTINRIVDNIRPVINCPTNLNIQGCGTSAITVASSGLAYSTVQQTISQAQFSLTGGSASDNCSITSIKYQDVQSGACPTVTRTFVVSDASGNTATCSQTISITDNILPDFTAFSQDFCVSNMINESNSNLTMPDWYLFKKGSTDLDVSNLTDNCTSSANLKLSWQIVFADGTSISGNGQPSAYGSDILFKGSAGVNTVHQIIYSATDLCGNVKVKNYFITIHPRPKVS